METRRIFQGAAMHTSGVGEEERAQEEEEAQIENEVPSLQMAERSSHHPNNSNNNFSFGDPTSNINRSEDVLDTGGRVDMNDETDFSDHNHRLLWRRGVVNSNEEMSEEESEEEEEQELMEEHEHNNNSSGNNQGTSQRIISAPPVSGELRQRNVVSLRQRDGSNRPAATFDTQFSFLNENNLTPNEISRRMNDLHARRQFAIGVGEALPWVRSMREGRSVSGTAQNQSTARYEYRVSVRRGNTNNTGRRTVVPTRRVFPIFAPNEPSSDLDNNDLLREVRIVNPAVLKPLEPTIIVDNGVEDEKLCASNRPHLMCAICLDFLSSPPVGCGKCSSRFCLGCLKSVKPQNDNGIPCPCCRQIFQHNEIEDDNELALQLEESLKCPRVGCGEIVTFGSLKDHEKICAFVKVRCKYSEFGCSWKGIRKDVNDHEVNECAYAKVSGLVERFRILNASNEQQVRSIAHLSFALQQTNRLVNIQNRLLSEQASRSPDNTLDVLVLASTCMFYPLYFFRSAKSNWKSCISNFLTRSKIFDQLYLIPAILLAIKNVVKGVNIEKAVLISLDVDNNIPIISQVINDPSVKALFDGAIMAAFFCCFCAAFYFDVRMANQQVRESNMAESVRWQSWRGNFFPVLSGRDQTFQYYFQRDITGFSLAALLYFSLYDKNDEDGTLFIWFLVLITTICVPPIIDTMLKEVLEFGPPRRELRWLDLQDACRIRTVILFALKFSVLFHLSDGVTLLYCIYWIQSFNKGYTPEFEGLFDANLFFQRTSDYVATETLWIEVIKNLCSIDFGSRLIWKTTQGCLSKNFFSPSASLQENTMYIFAMHSWVVPTLIVNPLILLCKYVLINIVITVLHSWGGRIGNFLANGCKILAGEERSSLSEERVQDLRDQIAFTGSCIAIIWFGILAYFVILG